jgi:hypothetical protein
MSKDREDICFRDTNVKGGIRSNSSATGQLGERVPHLAVGEFLDRRIYTLPKTPLVHAENQFPPPSPDPPFLAKDKLSPPPRGTVFRRTENAVKYAPSALDINKAPCAETAVSSCGHESMTSMDIHNSKC